MVHIKKKRTACGYLEDPSLRSSGLGKGSYFRNEESEAHRGCDNAYLGTKTESALEFHSQSRFLGILVQGSCYY